MAVELKIPTAGESITEVEIGEWFVKEGAAVKVDDPVLLIETDKASMELPAPVTGVLTQILKQAGEMAKVGEVVGLMEEGEGPAGGPSKQSRGSTSDAPGPSASANAEVGAQEPRVMPAARRALAGAGLEAREVVATGPGGRLLKEDVEGHKAKAPTVAETPAPAPTVVPQQAAAGPRQEEVVRMSRLRRHIAERLVAAQQEGALLTTFNEVDMSAVKAFRAEHKERFLKRHGVKLGFMSFFVKAVIEGLKQVPALNAEIRGEEIVYRNYYDIGVAVGGGRGLVVPVIRNAERLSFAEVEQTIGDLASRAQDGTIEVDELQGGTFTITNGGIYGSMLSTPIVNPPQSGILGMHNIVDRPMAVDGQVVIRPIMYVALTYDHRLVDGREAVGFLVRVKECIEQPARMLLEV